MKLELATSLKAALIFLTIVGIASVFVILNTHDDCLETSRRCDEDGKCISKRLFCNGVVDCARGSDEDPMACRDFTGLEETMNEHVAIYMKKGPITPRVNYTEENTLTQSPKNCTFYRKSGTLCKNLGWKNIPWHEVDIGSSNLHLKNVLHVDKIEAPLIAPDPRLFVKKFYLEKNVIRSIGYRSFCHLHTLEWLSLAENSLEYIAQGTFCEMVNLTYIDLSDNRLNLSNFQFSGMPQLYTLMLNRNDIQELDSHIFRELGNLHMLSLRENSIKQIHERAFRYNVGIRELNLSRNHLTHLNSLTFFGQKGMVSLDIGDNNIGKLQAKLFETTLRLKSLTLPLMDINDIEIKMFKGLPLLDVVNFKTFQYCRYVPTASRCHPSSDGLSTLENLLIDQPIRITVWIITAFTLVGNMAIFYSRCQPLFTRFKKSGRTPKMNIIDILITNVAIADFLMGIYVMMIAIKDTQYRDDYITYAYEWTTSRLCSVIGVMAIISTEVSILTISLIAVERFIVIARPFSQDIILRKSQAWAAVAIIWIFTICLAVAPVLYTWNSKTAFYGSTGLCFPLHLDDAFSFGWQYTAFIFIGLNSLCLIIITTCYAGLFIEILKYCPANSTKPDAQNMELAIRLFFTVVTDLISWGTIIVAKIRVLDGYPIPVEYISWLLVGVLPINAAFNPFLYTYSTGIIRVKLLGYLYHCVNLCYGKNSGKMEIIVLQPASSLGVVPARFAGMFTKSDPNTSTSGLCNSVSAPAINEPEPTGPPNTTSESAMVNLASSLPDICATDAEIKQTLASNDGGSAPNISGSNLDHDNKEMKKGISALRPGKLEIPPKGFMGTFGFASLATKGMAKGNSKCVESSGSKTIGSGTDASSGTGLVGSTTTTGTVPPKVSVIGIKKEGFSTNV